MIQYIDFKKNNKFQWSIFIFAFILTGLIYSQVINHEFINYDDHIYITKNHQVHSGYTMESIKWAFGYTEGTYWHPVTWLSHMLDVELFGLNPGYHHMSSVFLHLCNAILLFLLLYRFTGEYWKCLFVIAFFLLHPVSVESVAWAAERKSILSALFMLLTILAYSYYVKYPNWWRYVLSLIFFCFGLMSKPFVVTLPFLLLLIDLWPLNRYQRINGAIKDNPKYFNEKISPVKRSCSYLIIEKTPFFIVLVIYFFIFFYFFKNLGNLKTTEEVQLDIRIANAIVSYLGYLINIVWPNASAIHYPFPMSIPVWKSIGSGIILILITIIGLKNIKKYSFFCVGWFWFLGTLVPVLGILQKGTWPQMADRWNYFPLIGIGIIIAWGAEEIRRRFKIGKNILKITSILIILIFAFITWNQIGYWRNSITIFQHAVQVTKNNYMAYKALGLQFSEIGMLEESLKHHMAALRIKPKDPEAHYNVGHVLSKKKKHNMAIQYFQEAIKLNTDFAEAYNHTGFELMSIGKHDNAIVNFKKAISIKPDLAEAYNYLGYELSRKGRLDQAIMNYRKAIEINPGFYYPRVNLIKLLIQKEMYNDAINHCLYLIKFNINISGVYTLIERVLKTQNESMGFR